MIRCFVVDDEPPAIELVVSYIERTPFLELCGVFTNPIEALNKLQEIEIDLLYLDINMPDLTGLELSRLIDKRIKVVFTSAYESFALESYKVDALDYLLKPFSFQEFLRSAQKAYEFLELFSGQNVLNKETDFIFIKANYRIYKVKFDEILFIESIKDYVKIYLQDGNNLMSLINLKKMETNLPPSKFMKVHRSYIVNHNKIDTIEHGKIVFGKHYIPVSSAFKDSFNAFLSKGMID
jgi:two-component system, LytTR family, response regulator LytT